MNSSEGKALLEQHGLRRALKPTTTKLIEAKLPLSTNIYRKGAIGRIVGRIIQVREGARSIAVAHHREDHQSLRDFSDALVQNLRRQGHDIKVSHFVENEKGALVG